MPELAAEQSVDELAADTEAPAAELAVDIEAPVVVPLVGPLP